MSGGVTVRRGPDAVVPAPKHPWFKFFPSDWRGDERLAGCSLAARGLLAEFICLMHVAEPYGHLLVNGGVPTDASLARLVRATSVREMRRLCQELLDQGVLSLTADGVIYSRRMLRRAQDSAKKSEGGKRGGNPQLKRSPRLDTEGSGSDPNPHPKHDVKQRVEGGDKPHMPDATCQTPNPPKVDADEGLMRRAAAFLDRYSDTYARCRSGARYTPKEARDFPTAVELVSVHPDDVRLDAMVEVFLRMAPEACRGMNRPGSVNQFAVWAPTCDQLLREHGR